MDGKIKQRKRAQAVIDHSDEKKFNHIITLK
jgi:hypothetical protein